MGNGDNPTNYKRPVQDFRFIFEGIKTNVPADATGPTKYPYAQNIRTTEGTSVRSRAGLRAIIHTSGSAATITDLATYSVLSTDNSPIYLVRNANDNFYGNLGAFVGSMAGGGASPGASLLPFRPAESPVPWIYAANGSDYQKFSTPNPTVIQQKVGIQEPENPFDFAITANQYTLFNVNPSTVAGGDASAITLVTRLSDNIIGVFQDPAFNNLITLWVGNPYYSRFMNIAIGGVGGGNFMVQDVFPSQPNPVGISSIYYYAGVNGRCVIVPKSMTAGPGNNEESIYTQNLLGSIRRGSLITFNSPHETCMVLNVTDGPNGTICFEVSTIGHHTNAETFTCPTGVQIVGSITPPLAGAAITSQSLQATCGVIGGNPTVSTVTSSGGPSSLGAQFVTSNTSYQPDDYIHCSFYIAEMAALIETKILFDVDDGSFTKNFYYYTIRQSDVENAIQNTLTQLGAAQLVSQRETIDEEQAAASHNQLQTFSSAQTTPGDAQWAEIVFPISALTRVGNDQTKSLQNLQEIQFLVNLGPGAASYPVTVRWGPISIFGGSAPDVGTNGAPYMYRARPRSSVTGVKGNPSPAPRYGVSPRREIVSLLLPSGSYDPQIDTWDIFRYGGSVTSWRKIGQMPSSGGTFIDNYTDDAALTGEKLEFDNLEPWPTVDSPFNATASVVNGTTAVINLTSPGNVLKYLPGNLVRIGSINVYTLWNRPTSLGSNNYLFQFVENAGSLTSAPIYIYEPDVANQPLPYMWGPDASGTIFACGDPLRLGTFSTSKPYAPDSAPDDYNIEITSPSEPLMGGETIEGTSYVASPMRWWRLYPQLDNPTQRYSAIQQPMQRGLVAPWGHCNDGKNIYWWAKDGIWASDKGSLTDADLYNIFPHEGQLGVNYTYAGNTVYAPDYSRAGTFRLAYANGYLYATYQDSTGTPRVLTLDTRTGGWVPDVYFIPPTVFYALPQQAGTVLTETIRYPMIVAGDSGGNLMQPVAQSNDTYQASNFPFISIINTREWDGGDIRAGEQWGDLWLYLRPAASVTVSMLSGGMSVSPNVILPASPTMQQLPVSLGGGILQNFLGIGLNWIDDWISGQTVATVIEAWQPSFIQKPETIIDRFTDWYDGGSEKAKYVQGFLLHADTFNAVKLLNIRDSDNLVLHPFTPAVQQNGESIEAYSFNTPFIAHMMRIEPGADSQPWRFWDVDWIWEPTAEVAETWQTQGTDHGLQGYMHVKQVSPCYASTTPITLTITSFDGQSPNPINLPSTGGVMQKATFILTANKGQIYFYQASSSQPFQLFLDSWEILVGSWMRNGNYLRYRSLGGQTGANAAV